MNHNIDNLTVKLKASDIDLSHFKTRPRYRDGKYIGYDRLFIGMSADARDWISKTGLDGDVIVFGLGNRNITFIAQGDKVFYNTKSGAQAIEYIKAWSRMAERKYGAVELTAVDYFPTAERVIRSGGKRIQSFEDLMESAMNNTDIDYGI